MQHKHTLLTQQKLGRITPIESLQIGERLNQQQNSLIRLQKEKQNYLNQYDQLFRFITIWLLTQGYDLTNHQPHQVLKAVCLSHCSDWDMDLIIQQRHFLKKGLIANVKPESMVELQHCLHFFHSILQAYVFVSHSNLSPEYK